MSYSASRTSPNVAIDDADSTLLATAYISSLLSLLKNSFTVWRGAKAHQLPFLTYLLK